MFIHYFKYCFITFLRKKDILFWTLLFPIALSSFMYAAFGNITETTELAKPIPVVVIHHHNDPIFDQVLDVMSDGDNAILKLKDMNEKKALQALDDEKIVGIFYVDDKISLSVKGNNLKESVLSTFLDEYLQKRETMNFTNVYACRDKLKTHGTQDNLVSSFYAVLAMSSLFAVFSGIDQIYCFQGNLSSLGARRSIAPTPRSIIILAAFLAGLSFQFLVSSLAFFYMKYILRINFGDRILEIFPVLLLGNACGLSLGILIGSLSFPKTLGGKLGLATSFSMILSVADDLCAPSVRIMIEHNYPILNRLNPATVMSDALYSLNVYDSLNRYYTNLFYLGAIAFILCLVSYFFIRRNRYANI